MGFNAGALLHKESEAIFGSTPSPNDLGSKSMLPFFVTNGAAEFISGLDPKLADKLIQTPHKSERLPMLLQDSQVLQSKHGCKDIKQGSPIL